MSYFPQDSREPLHDGGKWHERQQHGYRQYQERPPMVERTNNTPAANPLLLDDSAFHKAAEALLVRLSRSGMTGEKFIYSSKMTPLDRSQFAAAFAKRYKNFPLFPAPNESKIDIVMRRIQNEFGKAFLKVVIPEQDADPQKQQQQRAQPSNYQHHPEAAPQSNSYHTSYQPRQHPEAAPQRWGGSPEHGFDQRYEAPRYDPRYNREEMVHSPQSAYSNYRDASPQAYTPPPYQQQQQQQHYRRRQHSFDSSQQSPRGPAPTSILKTKRPLTRNPVAQIMEVLPPAFDTTPASIPVTMSGTTTTSSKTTAMMKNQSSTRQALMQEIECTTQLMGSATDSNDKATYASHLSGLKRQLEKLTSKNKTANRSSSVLEIDQVLEPKKAKNVIRVTANSGGEKVLEMEKVIPPSIRPSSRGRSERRSSERRGVSKSPKRWRLRSRSRSKERRKSLQTAGAPSFEEEPSPSFEEQPMPSFDEQPMRAEEMDSGSEAAIPKVIIAGCVEPHHMMGGCNLDQMQDLVAAKPPMVRVKAPANLPPGYQLDAEYNDQTFVVTVPQGGVAKGQVFESIAETAKPTVLTPSSHERREVQHHPDHYSTWKGGAFECCAYGVDHPMFCNSFFCPQVALTQIMTRMKLSAYGERVTSAGSRLKMKTVLLLSSGYALLNVLLLVAMLGSPRVAVSIFAATVFGIMNAPALFAFIYVVVQTRRSIRAAEQIPEERCEGCEDLLISVWCTPCTVAQMMRQTADYDTYRAVWFSESGLPNHVFVDKDQPAMMPTIV